MGGDLVGLRVVRRVLHRAEVPNLVFLWDDNQTAGVLAGGAPDAYAARREAGFLRPGGSLATFGQVFLYVAEGGFSATVPMVPARKTWDFPNISIQ